MPLASFMIFWIIFFQRVGEYLGRTTVASWNSIKRKFLLSSAFARGESEPGGDFFLEYLIERIFNEAVAKPGKYQCG